MLYRYPCKCKSWEWYKAKPYPIKSIFIKPKWLSGILVIRTSISHAGKVSFVFIFIHFLEENRESLLPVNLSAILSAVSFADLKSEISVEKLNPIQSFFSVSRHKNTSSWDLGEQRKKLWKRTCTILRSPINISFSEFSTLHSKPTRM